MEEESLMNIENVDWQITSFCNRSCYYCFGPNKSSDLLIDNMKKIVDILKQFGTKQIGITGGEPLLYPDIEELVNYIYEKDMRIYLSTNCDFYIQNKTWIKNKVSILGIPIDGSTATIHNSIRGNNSYKHVLETIQDIYDSPCQTKLKIGTVITKNNYKDLLNIERKISTFKSKILFWKLYEMILYPQNVERSKSYKINELHKGKELGRYLDKEKIVFDTIEKRDRSYFFIKPNGDVFVPLLSHELSTEKIIGNLLNDNFDEILSIFKSIVNMNGYNEEYRYMKNI